MNTMKHIPIGFVTCVISLFILNLIVAANVKVTNLKCYVVDKNAGEFKICSLKAVNRDTIELSVHFGLRVQNVNNASAIVKFKRRGSNRNALFEYKIDLCEFLRSKRRNPLADLFYEIFQFAKYSNLNHTCPYDHDIILKGSRLNTQLLNVLAISQGEYTIFSMWFLEHKLAANIEVSILVN